MVQTTGNVTDDLSRNGDVYKDFQFFENNFGGVMPLEIIIDTKKKGGIMDPNFMVKVQKLQDELSNYEVFSKPVSYIEFVKYACQVYNAKGKPIKDNAYRIIPHYLDGIKDLIDSNNQINSLDIILTNEINSKARISLRMNDLATPEMDSILGRWSRWQKKKALVFINENQQMSPMAIPMKNSIEL